MMILLGPALLEVSTAERSPLEPPTLLLPSESRTPYDPRIEYSRLPIPKVAELYMRQINLVKNQDDFRKWSPHLAFSLSSSYGAEAAMSVMSQMADSASRGP